MRLLQITTATIKSLLRKRTKVRQIEARIEILKEQLKVAKGQVKDDEELFLDSLKHGADVISKMYDLEIKHHTRLGRINWQQEFKARYPDLYDRIQKKYEGKGSYDELIIARKA